MKNKKLKKVLLIVLSLIIIIVIACVFINTYVINSTKNYIYLPTDIEEKEFDCILVLGAGIREDNSPSLMLRLRLDKAVECYNKNISNKMLFSGDHSRVDYDEVNSMKIYAVGKGIKEDSIYLDHAGFSTYESLYRAKEIFGVRRIIIITQEYHLYRAIYIARSLGIEAYGVAADNINSLGNIKRDIREVIARCKDFFSCIIKPLPKYLGEPISLDDDSSLTNG